jgi:hypothetical protein
MAVPHGHDLPAFVSYDRPKRPISYLKTKFAKQEEEKASTAMICIAMQTKRVSMEVPLTS